MSQTSDRRQTLTDTAIALLRDAQDTDGMTRDELVAALYAPRADAPPAQEKLLINCLRRILVRARSRLEHGECIIFCCRTRRYMLVHDPEASH